jgi:hypothetical protein
MVRRKELPSSFWPWTVPVGVHPKMTAAFMLDLRPLSCEPWAWFSELRDDSHHNEPLTGTLASFDMKRQATAAQLREELQALESPDTEVCTAKLD